MSDERGIGKARHRIAHGVRTKSVLELVRHGVDAYQAQNLGVAEDVFRAILDIDPRHALALSNLGAVRLQRGDPQECIRLIDLSLKISPGQPAALNNRGIAQRELKRFEEALISYDQAIALQPDYAEAYNNRGIALRELRKFHGAVDSYSRAIAFNPRYANAYHNRGIALWELKRYEEAIASYDQAIALNPDHVEALNNRGIALRELKRYDEALVSYDQAIALNPRHAEAYNNRGIAAKELKRFNEAARDYDRATALKPDYVEAHWNKALLEILLGNYEEGWKLYEWRWKREEFRKDFRGFKQPLWLGQEPVAGKTVLLHAEQGLGDALQMLRYVPLLASRGARVVVEVPASLVSIASTVRGVTQVVKKGVSLPEFDMYCPLMSLPLAFKTTVATIPAEVPYLFAAQASRTLWRERLGPKGKTRIGLVWSGAAKHKNDHNRSIALQILLPLLECDAEFYSLQKEYREADRALMRSDGRIRDCSGGLKDFGDTAGLIEQLDLVISVDTSVAHLAGALGKPVWILLPYAPDYRWMVDRPDSPWYPTARLFRQPTFDDWDSVVQTATSQLRAISRL